MGKIHQPLNCTEAIDLMNTIIKGTGIQQALANFQRSRSLGNDEFQHGRVTKGWWKGFLKRHGHEIVTKRGKKIALNWHGQPYII